MQSKALHKYKALLFDVYGTLVDWETGMFAALQPILAGTPLATDKAEAIRQLDSAARDLQRRFPRMRYSEVLAKAHGVLAERLGTGRGAEADAAFGASIAEWRPFADTVPALAYLSTRYQLFVLSNVDRASFAGTRHALEGRDREDGRLFTAVYTAEDAGAYKPDAAALEYALGRMSEEHGVAREDVLIVAQSVLADIVPGKKAGIAGTWIARKGAASGLLEGDEAGEEPWVYKFETMGGLADAVEAGRL
ncbi:haloalkanoic acid dehalogenase [Amylocystis lapponica]|nr:haloalkanoic acid dehalogenase [Amylocystis lapponica]